MRTLTIWAKILLISVVISVVAAPWALTDAVYRFEPVLNISFIHDSNVGNSTTDQEEADQRLSLRPSLALTRESSQNTTTLMYQAQAEFFNENSDYDTVNHVGDLGMEHRFSTRTNFRLFGSYLLTSNTRDRALEDEIMTGRSDLERIMTGASVDLAAGQRTSLSFEYSFSARMYEDPSLTDSETHRARASGGYNLTPNANLSLHYTFRQFFYDQRGDANAHDLMISYDNTLSSRTSLGVAGGLVYHGYRFETADQDPEESATSDDIGFIGNAEVAFEGRRVDLTLSAERDLGSSGGFGQTLIRHSLTAGLNLQITEDLNWGVSGRVGRSDPTLEGEDEHINEFRIGTDLNFRFSRFLEGELMYNHFYQQRSLDSDLDFTFERYGINLIIYFIGTASP